MEGKGAQPVLGTLMFILNMNLAYIFIYSYPKVHTPKPCLTVLKTLGEVLENRVDIDLVVCSDQKQTVCAFSGKSTPNNVHLGTDLDYCIQMFLMKRVFNESTSKSSTVCCWE